MLPDPQAYADVLVQAIKSVVGPLQATVSGLQGQVMGWEAKWTDVGLLRERVAVLEARPDDLPEPDMAPVLLSDRTLLTDFHARVDAIHQDLASVRERVAVVETRPPLTGPAGADGADGAPGRDVSDETLIDLRARIGLLETKAQGDGPFAEIGALRERMAGVEITLATPAEPSTVDLGPVLERVAVTEARLAEVDKYATRVEGYTAFLQRDTSAISERLAVLEARPQLQGPAGEPGPPGTDGTDGKDGTPGLSFEGVYQDGKQYDVGQLATWAGSSWHCNAPTTTKPGDGSKDWTLMVKRGRDGKDATR